jgi:ABC-type phosphate transport system substrate-binding protein
VIGQRLYIPGTRNAHYNVRSTVTVSQTTNLVNQMVQVSWTGFTPSSQQTYDNTDTDYPVMIAECHGLDPTNPTDCYDATNGGEPASFGAYGPSNTSYATTEADGTGTADILLFTSVQNQFLNCGLSQPCSLVVVPSQGGDSLDFARPVCSNHTEDTGGTDLGQYAFGPITSTPFTANGYCSWAKRIVIPLYFALTPNGCPLRTANFTAGGSPMLADAMEQWQSGLCEGANGIELQYNGSLNESEGRGYFASGTDDVAFTTLPMSGPAARPFTYAPVAVSAVSVGYWVDNQNTGQPYTGIKLDARLLTKLLTTSYAYTDDACPGGGTGGFGCDNAVDGDPSDIYADREFQRLNPSVWQNASQPTGDEIPIVLSGDSDMTWETTSWLASDPAASSFLAGQFDPWGEHVNTYYLGLKYPINGFLPMDPYPPVSSAYAPVYPLTALASDMALNQLPGTSDTKDPTTGNYDALPPEVTGDRDMWSLIDQADATRFLIPAAALENAGGKFVEPTDAAMAAAVKDMTVNPDGITRSMNYTDKDPAAYPLTMVIYAVVPTGGISKAKAAAIARFLDYVADQGQQPGTAPGELAAGYLPMPQSLRAQTLKAATEVLDQVGDPKPKASPSASAAKSPSPSPSPTARLTGHSVIVSFSRPDSTGMSWVVLALLIVGLVLLIGGPSALVYGSPGARAAVAAGVRRVSHRVSRAGTTVRNWRRNS